MNTILSQSAQRAQRSGIHETGGIPSIAIVASARKLACLFWCLLTRGEDYAFAQPSLTKKKMRRLELAAGAPRWQGRRDIWSTNLAMRQAERDLALQAQRAYEHTVRDWRTNKAGAGATPGQARITKAVKRHCSAADLQAPAICALARRHPHPHALSHRNPPRSTRLDFHPSSNPAARRPSARRPQTAPFVAKQRSRPALLLVVPGVVSRVVTETLAGARKRKRTAARCRAP